MDFGMASSPSSFQLDLLFPLKILTSVYKLDFDFNMFQKSPWKNEIVSKNIRATSAEDEP
jgi:hypothetical protein